MADTDWLSAIRGSSPKQTDSSGSDDWMDFLITSLSRVGGMNRPISFSPTLFRSGGGPGGQPRAGSIAKPSGDPVPLAPGTPGATVSLDDIKTAALQTGLGEEGARVAMAIARTEGGLTGNVGDQGNCYDPETRVLTQRGFVHFAELGDTDELATRTQGGIIEYQKPEALQRFSYSGAMYHFKSRNIDLLVTPNHNMLAVPHYHLWHHGVRQSPVPMLVRADEMTTHRQWHVPVHSLWLGERGTLDKPFSCSDDAFGAMAGLYLSEGHVQKSRRDRPDTSCSLVTITQKDGPRSVAVKSILDGSNLAYRTHYDRATGKSDFKFWNRPLRQWALPMGGSRTKYIPRDLLRADPETLNALLTGLMLGDGTARRGKYSTVSRQLADDVAELCIKLGYGASIRTEVRTGERTSIYRVTLHGSEYYDLDLKLHLNIIPHWEGEVYCATVPNHTLLVERRGNITWCANSYGPYQFHRQGMLPAYASSLGLAVSAAGEYARQHPLEAAAWALSGYLGKAIKDGMAQGLRGPALATYAQRVGQRSQNPERAGSVYASMFK